LIVPIDKEGHMLKIVNDGSEALATNKIETTFISCKDAPSKHVLVQWDSELHQANPTCKCRSYILNCRLFY
jgi:hypothetical protein